MPYCKDENGRGPAWANSLFEDNAEYGYGMLLAAKQMREKIEHNMKALMELDIDEKLKEAIEEWLEYKDDGREIQSKERQGHLTRSKTMSTTDEVVNMLCGRIMELKDLPGKEIRMGSRRRRMGLRYRLRRSGSCSGFRREYQYPGFRYRSILQYRRTGIQGHAGSCYCEVRSRR